MPCLTTGLRPLAQCSTPACSSCQPAVTNASLSNRCVLVCSGLGVGLDFYRGGLAGDLKPENFCLAEPSSSGKPIMESLRLIDFGLSQRVRGGQAIAGLAGASPASSRALHDCA